jgi:hypothetical protein
LAALSFLDGVVEAEAVIPSGVSILLLCPRYYDVGFDIMVEQGGCVVQVTRVNSANILDEGLRIGGRGRRINSKGKDQTNKVRFGVCRE